MSDDTSSRLVLVTAPSSEPVTLAQAKAFLRIEHSADDDAITRAIVAARIAAENYLRTAILPQVWDYVIANPGVCILRLPLGPAQSITSVTLTDTLGGTSVMAAPNYRLSVDGFAVIFANALTAENVTVRYSASIAASAASVPGAIVQGILHHIAVLTEMRDGAAPIPMQSVTCYTPFRRIAL